MKANSSNVIRPQINYVAHAGQKEVSRTLMENFRSESPAHIVEVIASRGWGKTLWLCCDILAPYMNGNPGAQIMWVAPTYQIAMSPIEDVFKGMDEANNNRRWIPEFDEFGTRIWEFKNGASGPQLIWFNGATVTFKSADAADSIVSRGYNLIIIDEAALIQELTFTQQIMGTARKKGVKIFMITSPRGKKHWTHKIFLKGQDPADTSYLSFQQPWHKNPHFSPVLKKLMFDLPDWLRRQEYDAEFIEDGDSVFRGLDNVLDGPEITFESNQQEWASAIADVVLHPGTPQERKKPFSERRFVLALDLAKSVDYTVMYVMDLDDGSCAYYKRMNKIDYKQVVREAGAVCKRFNNADLIFDATGVGAGIADFLANEDVVAHPYVFTNDSKSDLVNKLALSIEYQEIKIPNIVTVRNELAVFTYVITRTGKISYNAPSGYHDDIVMSLSMANWFRKEHGGADEALVLEEIIKGNTGHGGRRTFLDEMMDDND